MTDERSQAGDGRAETPPPRTPEEVAAFEEKVRTVVRYEELVRADALQELDDLDEALDEAKATGDDVAAYRIEERKRSLNARTIAVVALLLAVLIVAMAVWMTRGDDLIEGSAGGDSASVEAIAPPEPAAEPADVLPPEVFTYTCADCGSTTVTQVPLELNDDAKYQFAYEADGARIAILSVVDGAEYDALAQSLEAAYAQAQTEGADVGEPKYLDDVGDGAVVYDTTAIFRNGDDCGVLWANTLQDAAGDASVTISPEELERLARIAAPRM
jgi:hypothetical protein